PEYARYAPLLIWLAGAAAVFFVSNAFSYAVTAARRLPEQLPIAVLSLAVCAVASYLLVPGHGLIGAAWAVLATEGTRLFCLSAVYAASSPATIPKVRQTRVSEAGQSTPARGLAGSRRHHAVPAWGSARNVRGATGQATLLGPMARVTARTRALESLALDLACARENITIRHYGDFLAFAKSVIRREADGLTGLSAYRGVRRKLRVHSAL